METREVPEFVSASFIIPRKEQEPVFYQFEIKNKKYIILIYYCLFALTEYLPLLCFVYFFTAGLNPNDLNYEDYGDPQHAFFFLFMTLAIILTAAQQSNGFPQIVKFYKNNFRKRDAYLYVACDMVVWMCITSLLAQFSISNTLMIIRTKFAYMIGLKFLRKFPLKKKDLKFVVSYFFFVSFVYFSVSNDFVSIFTMLIGGFVFFFEDTVMGVSQTFDETEMLELVAFGFLSFLYILKSFLNGSYWRFSIGATFAGLIVTLSTGAKYWVLRRMKMIQNDMRGELYNEIMIVFVALGSVFFDLLFMVPNNGWMQFAAGLFLMASLVVYRRTDIKGLVFAIRNTSNTQEPLIN